MGIPIGLPLPFSFLPHLITCMLSGFTSGNTKNQILVGKILSWLFIEFFREIITVYSLIHEITYLLGSNFRIFLCISEFLQ